MGAVQALSRLLYDPQTEISQAALEALSRLREDESRSVSRAADKIWTVYHERLVQPPRRAEIKVSTLPLIKREELELPYTPALQTEQQILQPKAIYDHSEAENRTRGSNVENAVSSIEVKKWTAQRLGRDFWLSWVGTVAIGMIVLGLGRNLVYPFVWFGLAGVLTGALQWLIFKGHVRSPAGWLIPVVLYLWLAGILVNRSTDSRIPWALSALYLALNIGIVWLLLRRLRE